MEAFVKFPQHEDEDGNVLAIALPIAEHDVKVSDKNRDKILATYLRENPDMMGIVTGVGAVGKAVAWRIMQPKDRKAVVTLTGADGAPLEDEDGNVLTFRGTVERSRYSTTIPAPTDEDGNYLSPAGAAVILSAWEDHDVTLLTARRFHDVEDEDGNVTREEVSPAGYLTRNVTDDEGNVLAWDIIVTPQSDDSVWRVASYLK